MPKCSVISRCCADTSSAIPTGGNWPRSNGGAVFDGEEEKPPPNWPGRMTKYRSGSSGRPAPTKVSMNADVPEYMCGASTALSLAALSVPTV